MRFTVSTTYDLHPQMNDESTVAFEQAPKKVRDYFTQHPNRTVYTLEGTYKLDNVEGNVTSTYQVIPSS